MYREIKFDKGKLCESGGRKTTGAVGELGNNSPNASQLPIRRC